MDILAVRGRMLDPTIKGFHLSPDIQMRILHTTLDVQAIVLCV